MLVDREIWAGFQAGARIFSFLEVHSGSGNQPASCSEGIEDSFRKCR